MKKVIPFIATIFLLCSCANKNIPSDIKDFVNAIDFRFARDHLESGSFTQTYKEHINGEVSGENSIDFTFSYINQKPEFHALFTYNGNQIKNNITKKEVSLIYNNDETYNFTVSINDEPTTSKLDYLSAYEYYYKIYDSQENSFRVGGLYYGDFIAINMNKFYKLYSLNDDKTELEVREENARYSENLSLSQDIKIDKYGMLLYKKEHATGTKTSDEGILIQNASYIYN